MAIQLPLRRRVTPRAHFNRLFDPKFRSNPRRYVEQCLAATVAIFFVLSLLDVVTQTVLIASLGASFFYRLHDAAYQRLTSSLFNWRLSGGYMLRPAGVAARVMVCYECRYRRPAECANRFRRPGHRSRNVRNGNYRY